MCKTCVIVIGAWGCWKGEVVAKMSHVVMANQALLNGTVHLPSGSAILLKNTNHADPLRPKTYVQSGFVAVAAYSALLTHFAERNP